MSEIKKTSSWSSFAPEKSSTDFFLNIYFLALTLGMAEVSEEDTKILLERLDLNLAMAGNTSR